MIKYSNDLNSCLTYITKFYNVHVSDNKTRFLIGKPLPIQNGMFFDEMQFVSHCYTVVSYQAIDILYTVAKKKKKKKKKKISCIYFFLV